MICGQSVNSDTNCFFSNETTLYQQCTAYGVEQEIYYDELEGKQPCPILTFV